MKLFALLSALPLLLFCAVPAFAVQDDAAEISASAREELLSALDAETRSLVDELLPDERSDGVEISWKKLLNGFYADAQTAVRETLRPFALLFALVLALAFVSALVGSAPSSALQTAALAAAVLQSVAVLRPLLSAGATLLHTGATFMKAFLPVYAGLVAFSGAPAAAFGAQSLVFALCETLSAFAETLCVRVSGIFLGLCCAFSLSDHVKMQRFLSGANRAMTWVLGLSCTVFTGVLGAKSVLSAAVDTAAGKSVRFLLGSAIPIVGAAMSDAYSSLVASIYLIRGSFAAVGVAVLLTLHVPVLVQSLAAMCGFKALSAAGDALDLPRTSALFRGCALALRFVLLLGVLELFLLLIAIGLLLQVKGGG